METLLEHYGDKFNLFQKICTDTLATCTIKWKLEAYFVIWRNRENLNESVDICVELVYGRYVFRRAYFSTFLIYTLSNFKSVPSMIIISFSNLFFSTSANDLKIVCYRNEYSENKV